MKKTMTTKANQNLKKTNDNNHGNGNNGNNIVGIFKEKQQP